MNTKTTPMTENQIVELKEQCNEEAIKLLTDVNLKTQQGEIDVIEIIAGLIEQIKSLPKEATDDQVLVVTDEEIRAEANNYAEIETAKGCENEIRYASDDFFNGAIFFRDWLSGKSSEVEAVEFGLWLAKNEINFEKCPDEMIDRFYTEFKADKEELNKKK